VTSPAGTAPPPESMSATLATLRDVAGVTGSFVFTRAGRVVARQLPSVFDDSALGEAGGRLARLRDTFAAVGEDMEVTVLRYGDHKLYLKALVGGMLCILTERDVNMPAMRMAANLVGRRIASALEHADAAPLPFEDDAPPPPAAPPERRTGPHAAALAPPGMRRFRGRPVE
jgi:predicted regulator of Ras-like GTPase activity (Roadblock/LC7/MglB family)